MTYTQALVLGVVQGLTEFLPVSSSGHLILVPFVLGWPDQGLAFDAVIHVGTLAALLAYFRGEMLALVSGTLSRRVGLVLLVATGSCTIARRVWREIRAGEIRAGGELGRKEARPLVPRPKRPYPPAT